MEPASQANSDDEVIHVYKRRWVMLLLTLLFTSTSGFYSVCFSIIPSVVVDYYKLSDVSSVDWLSSVFMLAYVPCIFPAIILLEKKGLRLCLVIGTFGMCLAAWLKAVLLQRDSYAVLVIGQTITAVFQVLYLSVNAPVAATWFPDSEVATATAAGVFGNMGGASLGFILTPYVVPYSKDIEAMGKDLKKLLYGSAVVSTVIFMLFLLFFQSAPPKPPSLARHERNSSEMRSLKDCLVCVLKDKSFLLQLVAFGICFGVTGAVGILIGQTLEGSYENGKDNSSYIATLYTVLVLPAAVITGRILDKTKRFKLLSCLVYICIVISSLLHAFTLGVGPIWVAYVTLPLYGMFLMVYQVVGLEFASESMYPEPENYTSALLYWFSQVLSQLYVWCLEWIRKTSFLAGNLFISANLFVGLIATFLMEETRRRHERSTGALGSEDLNTDAAESLGDDDVYAEDTRSMEAYNNQNTGSGLMDDNQENQPINSNSEYSYGSIK